ncbi:hypothetical protein EYF80_022625 [Liparis tanakae]|uniref:Uncharacterized protein n=1 Tax=Liparis tanakae TaxID=230148 RepID=A0A4Z2HPB0_9TELE|nr:hypothetical protein EYF80_022625 [Liparis tanakae]
MSAALLVRPAAPGRITFLAGLRVSVGNGPAGTIESEGKRIAHFWKGRQCVVVLPLILHDNKIMAVERVITRCLQGPAHAAALWRRVGEAVREVERVESSVWTVMFRPATS